jgi:8-oxo-dGTP diphosphatase
VTHGSADGPAGPYAPIIGTLVYVVDAERQSVLMVHRSARPDDEHLGKWNGLGGKLERDEDIVAGAARELAEEAGLGVVAMRLRGTVSWPGFGKHGEDWFGFVFVVDDWSGTPPASNVEGRLEWIPLQRVLDACSEDPAVRRSADLPMWEGDAHFLPLVFDDDPRAFHGVMPYANGRPVGWNWSRLDS